MLRIERAGPQDLAGAYRTCILTAHAGKDASAMHHDPDLLGHVYVGPYLVRGQGTQLVVVDEHGSAGYLLSTDDTVGFETWAESEWWPPLRQRYPVPDAASPDAELIGHIHAPGRAPVAIATEYPAHLHIDLRDRARGTGLGRILIELLLRELREREVVGVHLVVGIDNANAIGFYEHLGFREVDTEPGGSVMGLRLDG